MRDVRAILKTMILSGVDYRFYIKDVVVLSATSWRLTTCDTLHLKLYQNVTIDGRTYTITKVSLNNYIEVSGSVEPTVDSFLTNTINFYSGKLTDVQIEMLDPVSMGVSQVPFFWAREPYTKDYADSDSSIEQTLRNLTFYLVDELQPVGSALPTQQPILDTEDHHDLVIKPLENFYYNRIIPYIESNLNIFGEIDNRGTVRGIVGLIVESDEGQTERLFDSPLSGIEVRLDLPLMKEKCNC